jgi:DNA polymerase-3 subunit epsilon
LAQAVTSSHRIAMLARCSELIAARPTAERGWEIHVIRSGRLAAAGVTQPGGEDPRRIVERLQLAAEAVPVPASPAPAADLTEVGHITAWLSQPDVRIVAAEPELWLPVTTAHRHLSRLQQARSAGAELIDLRSGGPERRASVFTVSAPRVTRIAVPAGR